MITIVDAFERQAARRFEAIAVVADSDRLTYGELRSRSNQLAAALRRGGVMRGDRVVVVMQRSTSVPVALLAVLKVGAVYVPIDPGEPTARMAYLVADTGARAAICDLECMSHAQRLGLTIHNVRDIEAAPGDCSREANADDLAYLMYTSGSTGQPKAAMIEHHNVVNLATCPNYVDLSPGDRVLQLAPIAFDAATFEIWGPLLNGACLVMAPPSNVLPDQLGSLLRKFAITKLWLTAALFHRQIDTDVEAFRGVDTVLSGGDVLSVHHVQRLQAAVPGCAIVNCYGPTETTTFACSHQVRADERFTNSIPIGRPIQNVRVRVVNKHGMDVALGTPGELWIGGDGVGRGYWRREDLTAEKFVDDGKGCIYRSGDLVRQRLDGLLEFLGRIDGQMKLRGYRIEPGEVEHTIIGHAHVQQAVVALRKNHLGDLKLVAWIVPKQGCRIDRRHLRVHLARLLPGHMIPAAFVMIDQLPMTPNGKVDRAVLTVPDWRQKAIYV